MRRQKLKMVRERIVWLAIMALSASAGLTGWFRSSAQTKFDMAMQFGLRPSATQVTAFAGGISNHVSYEIFVSNSEKFPVRIRSIRTLGISGGKETFASS